MAAFLGEFLILDLDRDDARRLIAAHGVVHVEEAAIAGVGVGDHAGVDDARQRRDAVEHLRVGRDARRRAGRKREAVSQKPEA